MSARDREGAADALRRHFVVGRLSLDDFADRVRLALQARDSRELRRSLSGLPPIWRDGDELRRFALAAKRRAVMFAVSIVWLFATFVLLIAFAADTFAHGPTIADVVGYSTAWVIVTALAWRVRRRA
ncbi:MAG TPA: DUF1707 domain-containing protein [Gaiellaceae bacterium]